MLFKKILIVDDDEDIVGDLREIFTNDTWMVESASDGREAFDKIKKEPYAVALVDINMPRMNGISFIENIRKHGAKTQVIFMTGAPAYENLKRGVEEGIFHYVEKPFDTKKLLEIANRAFLVVRDNEEKDAGVKVLEKELELARKYSGRNASTNVKWQFFGIIIFISILFIFLLILIYV